MSQVSDEDWINEARIAEEQRANAPPPAEPDPITPIDQVRRPFRNNSYLTAVTIISENARNVLGGRSLELNEMTGRPELSRVPLRDEDVGEIRADIERKFVGGLDSADREIGLKLSVSDVDAACRQVARNRAYHPVRDFLKSLPAWDKVERLDAVPEELLGARRTVLNSALFRRFMISAVARAMSPGCKVDTMLVLVGPQGTYKSTLFRILAAPWFIDTALDISKKDAMETLRCAWIFEWAELETLARARDAAAVKAFITSSVDTYRPSYGRLAIDVPRGCVFVGSTNNVEFLADETGSRRFWPLVIGEVNIEAVTAQRLQLWAEALYRFNSGEPWWLSNEEDAAIQEVHEQHAILDAWQDSVLAWASLRLDSFSTADVLAGPLDKHRGTWTRGDEMRVAKILRRAGWERPTTRRGTQWVKR